MKYSVMLSIYMDYMKLFILVYFSVILNAGCFPVIGYF